MKTYKNILCIRADNMGDLVMTSPAIRALKETFNCRITVLTSSAGKIITPFIADIDRVITADLPWVKTPSPTEAQNYFDLLEDIKAEHFDLAVIFTVYSQSPLPAAMMTFEAGIPATLAYCRENPYHLISHWVPEKEPYEYVRHQVRRDLDLVASIGAYTQDESLKLDYSREMFISLQEKIRDKNADLARPYVLLHPGVSEEKRQYPKDFWAAIAREISVAYPFQIFITGSKVEQELAHEIALEAGSGTTVLAGDIDIEEMIALTDKAHAIISVNTGPVHIAAALQTPVLVLYALTNPQHTPWQVPSVVLPFSVKDELKSNNQVVQFMNNRMSESFIPPPSPREVLGALAELLTGNCPKNENILPC